MKKNSVLIVLVILAFGLVGTSLSALYQRVNSYYALNRQAGTTRVSYGFPLSWYGYSQNWTSFPDWGLHIPTKIYWFSLESLLLDASFWFAISFFVSLVAIESARALNLGVIARASVLGMKTSSMLLVMSLFFIVVGMGLCLVARSYLDLGLRLNGSGTVVLISTLLVVIWEAEQRQDAHVSHQKWSS